MKRRKRLSRRRSRAQFRRGGRVHRRNMGARPMRGGWRL